MNAAKKLLAIALAMPLIIGAASGVCASNGESSNATMCVTIIGDTITFVITLDNVDNVSSVLRIVPKPMPFFYDNETGILTTGSIDVKLVDSVNEEVSDVIAKTNCSNESAIPIKLRGSLNITYIPGSETITLGPFLFIRPEQNDPYDWGSGIINIRPEQNDPY